ncbi:MAG: hypothetical protein WC528_01160 [Patescibacteria group bacterium]
MPDINLLKDTLASQEERRKKEVFSSPAFKRPEAPPEPPENQPKSSSFFSSIKKIFSGKRRDEDEVTVAPLIKASTYQREEFMRTKATGKAKEGNGSPEDIFAEKITEGGNKPFVPLAEIVPPEENIPLKADKKTKKEEIEEGSGSFLVNLLPEELIGQEAPRQKLIVMSVSFLAAVMLIALVYYVLLFYQSSIETKTAEVKTQKIEVTGEISKYENLQKESIAFKGKIDAVSDLLDTHIYWTKFFEKLENNTLPDVYYSGVFNASNSTVLSLKAVAPDFETVAKQLLVFQNATDFATAAEITSARRVAATSSSSVLAPGVVIASQVEFDIDLVLNPAIFYRTENEPGENTNTNSNPLNNANANINVNTNVNSASNTNTVK